MVSELEDGANHGKDGGDAEKEHEQGDEETDRDAAVAVLLDFAEEVAVRGESHDEPVDMGVYGVRGGDDAHGLLVNGEGGVVVVIELEGPGAIAELARDFGDPGVRERDGRDAFEVWGHVADVDTVGDEKSVAVDDEGLAGFTDAEACQEIRDVVEGDFGIDDAADLMIGREDRFDVGEPDAGTRR